MNNDTVEKLLLSSVLNLNWNLDVQVDREYRVQKALFSAGFPVPQPILHCTDVAVIGTEFYLMEHVNVSNNLILEPPFSLACILKRRMEHPNLSLCLLLISHWIFFLFEKNMKDNPLWSGPYVLGPASSWSQCCGKNSSLRGCCRNAGKTALAGLGVTGPGKLRERLGLL